ncbi:MAG: transketolase family protein [Cyanobium sp.]
MRTAFINWLCQKAKEDPSLILLTADLGYSVVEPFAELYPGCFFNIGVAEQNMVGIAAGLASEGFRPYTYSIGIFPTFRCAEQLRNDIDYHQLPVVTCSVGSGVTYGALGYTHHMIQDLALMRSLPAMLMATPADPVEVEAILDWHFLHPCPLYLRLHKAGDPIVHNHRPLELQPGKWLLIYQPRPDLPPLEENCCVVVVGALAPAVVAILSELRASIPAFSCPLWGQPTTSTTATELQRFQRIFTVEDHLLPGGFGSWLLELSASWACDTRIRPITLPANSVGAVASEATLLAPLLEEFRQQMLPFSQGI